MDERADIVFRRGTAEDRRATFDLGLAAVRDLMERQNHRLTLDADAFWLALEPYVTHLAERAAESRSRARRPTTQTRSPPSGEFGVGPIAALKADDQTAILLHLEHHAHACGVDELNLQVPTVNAVAMRHLLGRGFKFDAPLNLFMSNRAFGRFDRFIAFSPSIEL